MSAPRGVVTSLLEESAEGFARALEAVPSGSAFVEIRADRLGVGETAALVRRARRPVIVACREASRPDRRELLLEALAAGAAYVDVELGSSLADLADGAHAPRVILSHHGGPADAALLTRTVRAMADSRAALLKLVPEARGPADAAGVRAALDAARTLSRPLACFASGRGGAVSRILALSWGSWGTYGALSPGKETAVGQLTARDLLDGYRVETIGPSTKLYGLVGRDLSRSPSPAMHLAGYRETGLDACFLPVEAERLDEALAFCGPRGPSPFEALGVTIPFKQDAARRARAGDAFTRESRAANTLVFGPDGPVAFNTDAPAALACVRRTLDPSGATVAIAGAGGTARAVAIALREAGAKVTLFHRDPRRGASAAGECGVGFGRWDDLPAARWSLLVQATPLGGAGEMPVPAESLRGKLVLDVVYGPSPTPLVRAARERGLAAVEGLEMLVEQGLLQFRLATGRVASRDTFVRAARDFLDARAS